MGQYTTDITLVNNAVERPIELVNELTYKVECKNWRCGMMVKKGDICPRCKIRVY